MLQFFKSYAENYLQSIDDKRAQDIIYKRYSLDGYERYTLEDLGKIYGVSRERIRQIEAKYNNKLKKLMMNKENISKSTELIIKRVKVDGIIPKEKVRDILGQNQELCDWESYYLSLIGILYHKKYDLLLDEGISKLSVDQTINRVRSHLKSNIVPMDRKKLFKQINKDNFTDSALDIITSKAGASTCNLQGDVCYSLSVDCSWSAGALAYRILWENQRPMSTDEILKEINNRAKDNKQTFNLVNQLAHMEAIQDISINHWALSEWGLEPRQVIVVMQRVLKTNNKAMPIKEVIEGVREILPDVKVSSIHAYANQDPYSRLVDGRVILDEWKDQYPECI